MARKPAAKTPDEKADDTPQDAPANRSNVSRDELLNYYRDMLLIRRFEERPGSFTGWA